ncbi:hypothetical protein [uncultured Pseudoteredinibacter sp.]|uniref:hypothetical protein n=1 Tax=uncultured Pseudoteredinibacter sp. TaxID=1641701 RepID=UPI002608CCE5|nr:hypothetical protein [uncultured Pseudoteredinibacter sp.]
MMLERRGIYNQGADFKMYMVDTIERLVRINDWVCWKIDLWRLQGVNSDNSALFYRNPPDTELRCPLKIDGEIGYLIVIYGMRGGYSLKPGELFPVRDFNAIMPELEKTVSHAIKTIEYGDHTISQPQPLNNGHHENIDTFGENIKVTHYPTAHLRVTGYSSSGVKECVKNPCVYRHLDLRKSNGDPSGLYYDESMYSTIKIKNRPWSLKLRIKGLELQSVEVREGVVYQSLKAHQPYDSSPTYINITVSENFCEDEGASSDIDQQTQCIINTIPLKEGQRLKYPPKFKESTLSRSNEPANKIYFVKQELSPNGSYKDWALIKGVIFRKGDDWVWLRGYTRPKGSRLDFANLDLMNKYLSIIDHSTQE